MWIVIARPPKPDAPYWPGRAPLALLDAVAWPAAWAAWSTTWPDSTGLIGLVMLPLAAVVALLRAHTALCRNHRYTFTTWRWGRLLAALLVVGVVIKLAVSVG